VLEPEQLDVELHIQTVLEPEQLDEELRSQKRLQRRLRGRNGDDLRNLGNQSHQDFSWKCS